MASKAPADVNNSGNWTYRNYKGVYGLTSPGWYVIHGQYEPYWNWWSADYSLVNSISSNSFFQLSGEGYSNFSIAYSYKDILNTDGTVYFPAGYASSGDTGDSGNTDTNTIPAPPDYSATGPLSWIAAGFEAIGNYLSSLLNWLNPFSDDFILKNVDLSLGNLLTGLSNILGFINPFSDNFILKGVLDFLGDLISFINPFSDNFIGKKIVELFQDLFVFLFVPSQEDMQNIFAPVRAKFAFVEKFNNLSDQIQTMLETGEGSPTFELNINSKYISGDVKILDFSFFAPYKPYSDLVITAFAYLLFAYRTIKHLPETISGLNSISETMRR